MVRKTQESNKTETKIVVRPVRRTDVDRVAELLSDLAGEKLDKKGAANRLAMVAKDAGQEIVVACFGKEIVGLLCFRIRQNLESVSWFGEVSSVIVDPHWRTRGVGRELMRVAEQLAHQRKCIGLWLVSGFGREEEAHKFYRRLGFKKTGIRLVKRFGEEH